MTRFVPALAAALIAQSAALAEGTGSVLMVENKYAWPRQDQLLLDGAWQLAAGDLAQPPQALPDVTKLDWFSVTVPTDVHWALYRAGRAPHPYEDLNPKELRWVED